MTATKTDSEIVELVLASFQKELVPVRHGWLTRLLYRLPAKPEPVVGYAQQYSAANEQGFPSGTVVGIWRITPEAIERMPADFPVPKPDSPHGRFPCTYFSFTLPDESGLGVLASQSAPLCGAGSQYRVSVDGIEMAGGGWIS